MDIRNDRGGFSAAEGCMFAAVGLFVVLLIALLILAVLRARNPPEPLPAPGRTVGHAAPPHHLPPLSAVGGRRSVRITDSRQPIAGGAACGEVAHA